VTDLADAVAGRPRRPATDPLARTRRLLLEAAVATFRAGLDPAETERLAAAVLRGEASFEAAASRLVRRGTP
jgi:ATP-dependent helicase YprA (DUF1998 family)